MIGPAVSVIVPAYNAADTLDATLASLAAQVEAGWEAIVVDDGSTDNTAGVAEAWARREPRVRVLRQSNAGASAARNAGLRVAVHDWVVFLDADDWLAPEFLSCMLRPIRRNRQLDGVFCGSVDIAPNGAEGVRWLPPRRDDFFKVTVHNCPIAVHAALVRRSLIMAVGAWDETLATCEDWDLWQRLARTTNAFAVVERVLSFIRLRPGSLSRSKAARLAADGLTVIRRTHAKDPRIEVVDPRWGDGWPKSELPEALSGHLAWTAGIDIAEGGDGTTMLDQVEPDVWAGADPHDVALSLHDAISQARCRLASDWPALWPELLPKLKAFLDGLEQLADAPGFCGRALRHLEHLVLQGAEPVEPIRLGTSIAHLVDLVRPVTTIAVPKDVERLVGIIALEGWRAGTVSLPITNGEVTARSLEVAIAEQCGARLTWRHAITRGWRQPRFWATALRLAARPRTVRLALVQAQLDPRSRRERLRAFLKAEAPELLAGAGLLRRYGKPQPTVALKEWTTTCGDSAGSGSIGADSVDDAEVPAYWDDIFSTDDPWDYDNEYERTKYEETLELLGDRPIGSALELACAEGHFTQRLASRVERLIATDISARALKRAASRCARHGNIEFAILDLARDPFPGAFELIVCSEVLYYVDRRRKMRAIANRIAKHLQPGGLLLMAHANVARNQPEATGFDWGHGFDGRSIGKIFAATPGLGLVRELRTPLYRIQLFERKSAAARPATGELVAKPRVIERPLQARLNTYVASQIEWNGAAACKRREVTDRLPILMYHRVAPQGAAMLDRYRVTPERFESHLRFLTENGYYGITLDRWRAANRRNAGMPGRAVLLTFDDGYLDFAEHAWPLLQHFGFPATVFVVAGMVGGQADWDRRHGEPAPLMTWPQLRRLADAGVVFGSHTLDHPYLTTLGADEIRRQGSRSRAILQQELDQPIDAIAYPFGDTDEVVARLMQDCGYAFGLTTDERPCGIADPPLRLDRIEITGSDTPETLRARLPPTFPTNRLRAARLGLKDAVRRMKRDWL